MLSLSIFSSNSDSLLKDLIKNSYKNIRVVGRGTVLLDRDEVYNSSEFIEACKEAKLIVENQ